MADKKLAHEIADWMLWECAEESETGVLSFWYDDIDRKFGTDLHSDREMLEAIIDELDDNWVQSLEERLNFAWQDDEYDEDYAREMGYPPYGEEEEL